MASQAQIYDQIYAQRQAEFIEKQKIANEQYIQRKENEESKKKKEIRALISSSNKDKTRKVRLHHPQTRRQIGEAVFVHYKSDSVMMFELVNHPGKMMRVNGSGKVEFAAVRDDTATFELEATYSGNLYFLCSAFREVDNVHGGKGWYLSMSQYGQLTGNGGKGEQAQWVMLTEQPPAAAGGVTGLVNSDGTVSNPNSNSTNTSNTTINPLLAEAGASILNSSLGSSNDGDFPGVGAGVDALMRYFVTAGGARFLGLPEYAAANKLYLNNGLLAKILHRPDWPLVANYYVDHTSSPLPPLRRSVVDSYVSYADFKAYFEQGYAVCRGVIPTECVVRAQRIVNYYTGRFVYATVSSSATPSGGVGGTGSNVSVGIKGEGMLRLPGSRIQLNGSISSDPDILALFYTTPVTHIVQRLIGAGDVTNPTSATVVTTHPTIELIENNAIFHDRWYVDSSSVDHSPYTLLLGVALTDIVHDGGAYCVHSGSHLVLMEAFNHQVKTHGSLFSADPSSAKKTDLGEPTQLTMKAGDVFLCSQRTAYLHSLNTTCSPTTLVYFKISHVDHAALKHAALESLWVEYKHASYYIESTGEGHAELQSAGVGASSGVASCVSGDGSSESASASAAPVVAVAVASAATNNTANTSTKASSSGSSSTSGVVAAVAIGAATTPAKSATSTTTTPTNTTSNKAGAAGVVRSTAFPINGAIRGTPTTTNATNTANTNATASPKTNTAKPSTTVKTPATTASASDEVVVVSPKQSQLLMGLLDSKSGGDIWNTPLSIPNKSSAGGNSVGNAKSSGNTATTPTASAVTSTVTPIATAINTNTASNTTTNSSSTPTNNTSTATGTPSVLFSEVYPEVPTTPVVLNPFDVVPEGGAEPLYAVAEPL